MKPNKSILKRVKTTKSGKLLKRRAGIDHFNAKASRGSQTFIRKKDKTNDVAMRGLRQGAGMPASSAPF